MFIATDLEPEPILTFPLIDTSEENKARLTTYKLLFKDKSPPTDKFPLNEESLITKSFAPRETSEATYKVFLKIVRPLTSNAYPADISLLIETDAEPDPNFTFPLTETSERNNALPPETSLPFKDKSEPKKTGF